MKTVFFSSGSDFSPSESERCDEEIESEWESDSPPPTPKKKKHINK
jgi:hypothetical protein